MIQFLQWVNSVVWGLPALVLIIGVGIYLTLQTRFAQFRLFPKAMGSFLRPVFRTDSDSDKSKRRALYTALAATVGTGNLAGVAGAIALGGPGAIFWMWVCGFLGMVTKLAEATLAVRYRRIGVDGEPMGGPMYMILQALKPRWHWLAYMYCFFGVVASFGVGNGTQINTVVGGIHSALHAFYIKENIFIDIGIGLVLGILILLVMSRGAKGIGQAAERLVPPAALFYVVLCLVALFIKADAVPGAFRSIITGAFSPRAATGGVLGSFFVSLRVGASRGVFTNEAGMGTAAMAHATASVSEPMEQGLMGIVEVFIDTIVICTMTALVILSSGITIPYGYDTGIVLTSQAFVHIFGQWVSICISIALCLFAFATVLGWGLYGLQCARFLFGDGCVKQFVFTQAVMAVVSAVISTGTLWLIADIVNALMAIPNLIVLAKLAPEVGMLACSYRKRRLPRQAPQDQPVAIRL